jgi:DNA-binding NarL/FixJ family response regulator
MFNEKPKASTSGQVEAQRPHTPIRIFLVDDHELVRRGIKDLFNTFTSVAVVGEASHTEGALRGIAQTSPDVAILDVRLGDESGVELCREVRSMNPHVNCLMLTSFADDEALVASVLAGASGYVLKDIRGNELVEFVHRVANGERLISNEVAERVTSGLGEKHQTDARLERLTPQERRILELISQGLTNRQIAESLYLAEKTVKNYVSHLLAKLGMARRSEAAAFAARLDERNHGLS